MGTLGDNLLKLTEFPFSYSLIGLLALIFGKGLNLEEVSLANLGPLLILMGFVATTLSITDPIGVLQKGWLSRSSSSLRLFSRLKSRFKSRYFLSGGPYYTSGTFPEYPQPLHKDGTKKTSEELEEQRRMYESELIGITLTPASIPEYPQPLHKDGTKKTSEELEEQRRRYKWRLLYFMQRDQVFGLISAYYIRWTVLISLLRNFQNLFDKNVFQWASQESSRDTYPEQVTPILHALLSFDDSNDLVRKLYSIRSNTSRTTWIVREIDKITAMVYFAIIVSIFISAEFLLPGFLDKFLVGLQGGNQTEDGGQNATTTGGVLLARIIIIVFSFSALGAVLYMLYSRLHELRSKAMTTFIFLVELDAIKIENERFNPSLKDIERYLTNGDWTMAQYWVDRVMDEYDYLIRDRAVKGKGVEKKE